MDELWLLDLDSGVWHAKNSSSEMYLYRNQAADYIETKKMVLLK